MPLLIHYLSLYILLSLSLISLYVILFLILSFYLTLPVFRYLCCLLPRPHLCLSSFNFSLALIFSLFFIHKLSPLSILFSLLISKLSEFHLFFPCLVLFFSVFFFPLSLFVTSFQLYPLFSHLYGSASILSFLKISIPSKYLTEVYLVYKKKKEYQLIKLLQLFLKVVSGKPAFTTLLRQIKS